MLKFSKKKILKKDKKKYERIFENISIVKMKSSKLINCAINMCCSGQGTTIINISMGAHLRVIHY
jgi:hypothetical protein